MEFAQEAWVWTVREQYIRKGKRARDFDNLFTAQCLLQEQYLFRHTGVVRVHEDILIHNSEFRSGRGILEKKKRIVRGVQRQQRGWGKKKKIKREQKEEVGKRNRKNGYPQGRLKDSDGGRRGGGAQKRNRAGKY